MIPSTSKKGGPGSQGRGQRRVGGEQVNTAGPPFCCAEYKECFSLYDTQQRGKIKATDLLVAMRCLGASPTPGEVQRHLQTHRIGE